MANHPFEWGAVIGGKGREKENISFAVFGISWARTCFNLGLDIFFICKGKIKENRSSKT